MPNNEEFLLDFQRFSDNKKAREIYFLAELENMRRRKERIMEIEIDTIDYDSLHILSREDVAEDLKSTGADLVDEYIGKIGNKMLLERALISKDRKEQFQGTSLLLTRDIKLDANIQFIDERQGNLATLAVETWKIPKNRYNDKPY